MKFYHRVLHSMDFLAPISYCESYILIEYMSWFKKKGIDISKVNYIVF